MTFKEELQALIEKHYGKVGDMDKASQTRRNRVFLEIYYENLVPIMKKDFSYTLQIVDKT